MKTLNRRGTIDRNRLLALLILTPLAVPIFVNPTHAQGIPSYSVTAIPTQVSLQVGSSTTTTINVTSLNGFSGTVNFHTGVYPYAQLNVTLSPSSVTVPADKSATTTATISANNTATPADYQIILYATSGTDIATGKFNATVTAATTSTPDFSLSASLTSIPVAPDIPTSVTITATSLAGFSGDINLTDYIGKFNPNIIRLTAGGTATTTLTLTENCPITTPPIPPQLQETFEIDAKSGARLHWLPMLFYYQTPQPIFCFYISPYHKTVIGSSEQTYLNFGTVGDFTGNITLTTQTNFQTSFFPTNKMKLPQPPVGGGGAALIAVTVPANTLPGNYTLTVIGTSGSQTWRENETIQAVTGPYFTMTVNPTAITVAQGSSRNLLLSLTGEAGFSAHVWLFSPLIVGGPLVGTSSYDIIVNNGETTQVTVTVDAYNAPPGNYAAMLQIETQYMPYIDSIQVVPITVQAAPLPIPDVSILPTPSTLNIQAGSTSTVKITIAGLNGYVGNVLLGCKTTLPAVNCWLDSSYMILDNVNRTITLNVATDAALSPGTYPVVVSIEAFEPSGGQGSNIARSTTVNLVVTSPNILGAAPAVFYATIGAIVGVAAIGTTTAFLLLRMRKPSKTV